MCALRAAADNLGAGVAQGGSPSSDVEVGIASDQASDLFRFAESTPGIAAITIVEHPAAKPWKISRHPRESECAM
jgi:hypothetical protein